MSLKSQNLSLVIAFSIVQNGHLSFANSNDLLSSNNDSSQLNHSIDDIRFVEVAISVPLRRTFEYAVPEAQPFALHPGMRVEVPFSGRTKVGIIMRVKQSSDYDSAKIKPFNIVLDEQPLVNQELLKLVEWMIRYYHAPPGEVWQTFLPTALMKGQPTIIKRGSVWQITETGKSVLAQNKLAKTAVKQRQTLVQLKLSEHSAIGGIDDDTLNQVELSRTTLKTLAGKQWVQQSFNSSTSKQTKIQVNIPENLELTSEQVFAIEQVSSHLNQFITWLLFGVTASGKTEVYLRIIEDVVKQNKQALILVPEIGLTPQTVNRFRQRFDTNVEMLHSAMTEKQRLQVWLKARSGEARIIIGTRSSLFVPLKSPGIIIIDEEHDNSFKQQQGLRYSARDIAMVRGSIEKIPVLLGSASPSIETLMNVNKNKIRQLNLKNKAISQTQLKFKVIDLKNQPMRDGLSFSLIDSIKHHISNKGQVLLFLNRRGYSPVLLCHTCGFSNECQRCESHFTYHSNTTPDTKSKNSAEQTEIVNTSGFLQCHHCGSTRRIPKSCPKCDGQQLTPVGLGTERLEETISRIFPEQKVIRIDRDTTRKKSSMQHFVEEIKSGEVDILIGTQMLAKGHHFPKVTLVALVDMDGALYSSDFRAPEYAAQLITQVSGRAGRAEQPGEVIIQTHHADHVMLQQLLEQGYSSFAKFAMQERIDAHLPPHTFNALFQAEATYLGHAKTFLSEVKQVLKRHLKNEVEILGPVPAFYTKKAGKFRYQLYLESANRKELHQLIDRTLMEVELLQSAKKVRWRLEVDPIGD
jgi:primosomal protein N' (replication factor Y)